MVKAVAKKKYPKWVMYAVALDRNLVKDFRAACLARGRKQNYVLALLMRQYIGHQARLPGLESEGKGKG